MLGPVGNYIVVTSRMLCPFQEILFIFFFKFHSKKHVTTDVTVVMDVAIATDVARAREIFLFYLESIMFN